MIKKFIKKIILTTTSSILFCNPLISCKQQTEVKVDSVEIETQINDITLNLGENFKSDIIKAICYDENHSEILDAKPKIQLFCDNGNELPDWININNDNQICIFNVLELGTWTFNIEAKFQDIKSNILTFKVSVIDTKKIPDNLEIVCQSELDMLTQDKRLININLIAYKDNEISSECNKLCSWKIVNIHSNNISMIIPTFNLEDLGTCACLYCETNQGLESIGEFEVTIQAQSLVNLDLLCSKTIKVLVSDGETFIDQETGYSYKRMSTDADWILYKVPENTEKIENVKSEIQGLPVYKIFDNLCFINAGETAYLKSIDLPASITEIGKFAFSNQKNLTNVCMPGVKNVGESAFNGCENMFFSLSKPEPQFENLENSAFENCKKLKIYLNQPTVDVKTKSFANTGIEKIYFNKLWHLEDQAFANCTNLVSFTIDRLTPPFLNGDPFKNVHPDFKIYVPQSDINDYLTDKQWSKYSSIIVGF